jgi:hypothetical protein
LRFDTENRMIVRSPRESSGCWGEAGRSEAHNVAFEVDCARWIRCADLG